MRHARNTISPPAPAPARASSGFDPRAGGFGLIELIIAMSLFSILMGGIVVSLGAGLALARNNRERSVAANLAADEMDAIRQTTFSSLTLGFTTSNVSVDGVPYTVDRNLEWVGTNATAGECDSTTTSPQVVRATVEVSWTNMKAIQPVRTSTVLAPPIGSYVSGLGHIAVRVRNSDAQPSGGVPVKVLNSGLGVNQTLNTTDASSASPGCAFFGFLTPGTYAVSLNTAGYVDRQGTVNPTQNIGVNGGQIASVAFDYDRAASLQLTLAGLNGGTPANATAVSLGNTGYLPSGWKVFSGTGASRTLSNLYPFGDGYEAWAGSCADADPEGKDSSGDLYWPGATRADALAVDPNTTTAGTVTMATVQVNFTRTSGSGAVTINAVHASGDPRCSSGQTLAVASFTVNASTTIALPYGTWTLQASGKTPVGSWPVVTLDPRVTTTATANVAITS
jgi:prepilin-type N-terminal cleavage/methylation domain-containing protein